MEQVNYIVYYESFSSKELVKTAFNKQFKQSLVYELQEVDRLLAGLVSGYFHFALFVLDQFEEKNAEFIKKLVAYKGDAPFIVIANDYKITSPYKKYEFYNQKQIYFLNSDEIYDLPGISLRILKDKGFFKRLYERKPSKLKLEIGFGFGFEERVSVQLKNISRGGLQFHSRSELEKNECPILFYKTIKGESLNVPIQVLWRKKNSDGRWTYGAKYLNAS